MKYPLEEKLPYMWLALAVLAIFYGIYFSKMLAQKRHGIRTHQIGRRKEKTLHTIEMLMGIATLGARRLSCCPLRWAGAACPQTRASPASASECWAI